MSSLLAVQNVIVIKDRRHNFLLRVLWLISARHLNTTSPVKCQRNIYRRIRHIGIKVEEASSSYSLLSSPLPFYPIPSLLTSNSLLHYLSRPLSYPPLPFLPAHTLLLNSANKLGDQCKSM